MTEVAPAPTRRFSNKTIIALTATGALVGAAFGYGAMRLLDHLHVSPKELGWTDFLALWLGLVFIAYALLFGFLSTSPKHLAQLLEGEQATVPASHQEVNTARLQSVVLLLAGFLLMLPIFVQHLLSRPAIGAQIFALIAVLFAVQTWANIRLWLDSDEFGRRIILEVCALTFAIGQGFFFLWAAAEHLHLVHSISAWNIYSLLMMLYLLSSSWAGVRHSRS